MSQPRKLRLDLQDLEVESFDPTLGAPDGRGTVYGRNETQQTGCYTAGLDCHRTPGASCLDTCYATCPGVSGCAPYDPTQEPTCLDATCYWVQTVPYYDGIC